MGERWRAEKRSYYPDLIWHDDPDGRQTKIAEVYWPDAAERIVAAVNRAAGDAEREAGLQEIAAGMAACVEALDKNQLWFSRSHVSLTLRDSLRTWAEEYAALSASTAPRADAEGQGES